MLIKSWTNSCSGDRISVFMTSNSVSWLSHRCLSKGKPKRASRSWCAMTRHFTSPATIASTTARKRFRSKLSPPPISSTHSSTAIPLAWYTVRGRRADSANRVAGPDSTPGNRPPFDVLPVAAAARVQWPDRHHHSSAVPIRFVSRGADLLDPSAARFSPKRRPVWQTVRLSTSINIYTLLHILSRPNTPLLLCSIPTCHHKLHEGKITLKMTGLSEHLKRSAERSMHRSISP